MDQCILNCIANVTNTSVSGLSGTNQQTVITVSCAVAVSVVGYLLKLPSVQRFLGAENTEKKQKLHAIYQHTCSGSSDSDSANESTPIVKKAEVPVAAKVN